VDPNLVGAERDSGGCAWRSDHISAHSTQIGAAHDLAASGIDLRSVVHSGGWNDPKMPRHYTRELAAKESGMGNAEVHRCVRSDAGKSMAARAMG